MIRHLLGRTVLALSVGAWGAAACSDDDAPGPASPGGGADAGASSTDGGAESAGGQPGSAANGNGGTSGSANGGAAEPQGGTSADAGAAPADVSAGGSDAPTTGGGDGGGASEPEPGPPDLILDTGGPWPDSFTGSCANAKKSSVCPAMGGDFFGQDGTYRLNVPTYKATSTTLTDSVTGLVWQLAPETTQRTQAAAASYCDALTLAGKDDWRLPTRLEYVSVLDEGASSGQCMPPDVPADGIGTTWTASPSGVGAGQFFTLNEQYGAWNIGSDTSAYAVRCVRGATSSGSRAADTGVVSDAMTQLIWQAASIDDTGVTWQGALAYCEGLTHAGKDDWRLPSIKELATLVDESLALAPVLYADLGGTAAQYWSSTPAPSPGSDETFAFTLETSLGISPSLKVTSSAAAARCVRSAD